MSHFDKAVEAAARAIYEAMPLPCVGGAVAWEQLEELGFGPTKAVSMDRAIAALTTALEVWGEPTPAQKAMLASAAYEAIRMEEKWPELFHHAWTAMIDTLTPKDKQP